MVQEEEEKEETPGQGYLQDHKWSGVRERGLERSAEKGSGKQRMKGIEVGEESQSAPEHAWGAITH